MELYQSFTEEDIDLIAQAWPSFTAKNRKKPTLLTRSRPVLRVILIVLGVVLLALTALLAWVGGFEARYLPFLIIALLAIVVGVTGWQVDTVAATKKLARWILRRKLTKNPPHSVTVADGTITTPQRSLAMADFHQVVLCQDLAFCSIGKRTLICKVPQDQQAEFLCLLSEANPQCLALSKTPEELTAQQ
jgi:hypothetical protein